MGFDGGRAVLLGLAITAGACTAISVRPHYVPLPGAVVDTLIGQAPTLVEHLAQMVRDDSILIQRVSPAEGFLETRWHDFVGGGGRMVRGRLRFYVDPVGTIRTEVRGEAVYLKSLDPSVPEREREVMAATGHPARTKLDAIMVALRERFGR